MCEMRKERIMISQPMAGLTDEEILTARKAVVEKYEKLGYEVVNSFFNGEVCVPSNTIHESVLFLSMSIKTLSTVDAIYFAKGWDNARGCLIEYEIARQYGIDILYGE